MKCLLNAPAKPVLLNNFSSSSCLIVPKISTLNPSSSSTSATFMPSSRHAIPVRADPPAARIRCIAVFLVQQLLKLGVSSAQLLHLFMMLSCVGFFLLAQLLHLLSQLPFCVHQSV
jgi:hypothetical protein